MLPVIALLTDFGCQDHYVGVMKGVILSINPEVSIVDLNHNISPGNIKKAAYQLSTSYKFFPPKTIFVVVIDPGVGTKRKAILANCGEYYFISPDNGLLSYILNDNTDSKIISISNTRYFSPKSNTFHGRDIFSPVAAHLSKDYNILKFGDYINTKPVKFKSPGLKIYSDKIIGTLQDIDRFGNLITNIPGELLINKQVKFIKIKGSYIKGLSGTYADSDKNELLALIGSSGFLEISVNQGSAEKFLNISDISEKVICSSSSSARDSAP